MSGAGRRAADGSPLRARPLGAGLPTPPPARPQVSRIRPDRARSDPTGRPSVRPRAGSGDPRPTVRNGPARTSGRDSPLIPYRPSLVDDHLLVFGGLPFVPDGLAALDW